MHRRNFLEAMTGSIAGTALLGDIALEKIHAATKRTAELSPQEAARDELLWSEVQQAFSVNRNIINLDNGNVCPSPRNVTEAMVRYTWQLQDAPGYMLWEILEPLLSTVRVGLAKLFGCEAEEIALVRNATEALDAVLLGVELRPNDEILMSMRDYWAMHDAVDQRARREGIVVKKIKDLPILPKSMDELVEIYEQAITPKTRLILITHPTHQNGQLFPVKQICEIAHQKGIEVVVDGAQSFAHIDYKQSDLACDYFGASLHKWLCAPIGTGMLYIRKDKIGKVQQLVPATSTRVKNYNERIYKFEDSGTRSVAATLAITQALAFHNSIGSKRKEERLRYLTHYWAKRIRKLPNARFFTSLNLEMSCGLATFDLKGVESIPLILYLWQQHRIVTQYISGSRNRVPEIKGIRVTPNVYTTLDELDYFCEIIEKVAKQGLPKSA